MIRDGKFAALLPEWESYISSQSTKHALRYIIGFAAGLHKFQCYPKLKGKVRAFRFFAEDEKQPFAFIVNKKSLLFYFRLPAVRSGRYVFESVKSGLPLVRMNESGEWTVKLRTIEDAQKLCELLDLR